MKTIKAFRKNDRIAIRIEVDSVIQEEVLLTTGEAYQLVTELQDSLKDMPVK